VESNFQEVTEGDQAECCGYSEVDLKCFGVSVQGLKDDFFKHSHSKKQRISSNHPRLDYRVLQVYD
jgi:hypothetical protein